MGRRFLSAVIACNLFCSLVSATARGGILFESATQGPPVTNIFFQPVMGSQVLGVRFFLSQPVTVTHLGAHALSDGVPGRQTYASLIALTGAADVPNSFDRSTSDFLATTTLAPTNPSSDVEGAISPLAVGPGWYAMMCGEYNAGTGTFLVRGNTPVGSPTFFTAAWPPDTQYLPWLIQNDVRMYVRGVPDPSCIGTFAGPLLLGLRVRRHTC